MTTVNTNARARISVRGRAVIRLKPSAYARIVMTGRAGLSAVLPTGTVPDILNRLKALLPSGWFPYATFYTGLSQSPILDAVLTGAATGLSFIYNLLQYARLQTRIATMQDGWLDLASYDLFNYNLLRLAGETDLAFRIRIIKEFLRVRNTRTGIINMMTDLTGLQPRLIEPWNPVDTGAWDEPSPTGGGVSPAYDVAGAVGEDPWTDYTYGPDAGAGYGEQSFIAQVFVIVYRPTDGRVWNDSMVAAALERVRAAGTIIWVKLSNLGQQMTTSIGGILYMVTESGAIIVTEGGVPIVAEGPGILPSTVITTSAGVPITISDGCLA